MQTKHLLFLIHIRNKSEVAIVKMFKPSSDFVQSGASFVDPFCYLCFWFVFVMLYCLFIAVCGNLLGKG